MGDMKSRRKALSGEAAQGAKPERIAAILRAEIVSGMWLPHADMPSEKELMQRFDVSRPTYRESIRLLESQGLLKRSRGAKGGAMVVVPGIAPVTQYSGAYLQMNGATGEDVWKAILSIEPAAICGIALASDMAVIAQLAQIVAAQHFAVADAISYGVEELKFRTLIFTHCDNPVIRLFGTILAELAGVHARNVMSAHPPTPADERLRRQGVRTKAKLISLLECGDVDGSEKLWIAYLKSALKRTLKRERESGSLRLYFVEADG